MADFVLRCEKQREKKKCVRCCFTLALSHAHEEWKKRDNNDGMKQTRRCKTKQNKTKQSKAKQASHREGNIECNTYQMWMAVLQSRPSMHPPLTETTFLFFCCEEGDGLAFPLRELVKVVFDGDETYR
jgi:hypothetical protein